MRRPVLGPPASTGGASSQPPPAPAQDAVLAPAPAPAPPGHSWLELVWLVQRTWPGHRSLRPGRGRTGPAGLLVSNVSRSSIEQEIDDQKTISSYFSQICLKFEIDTIFSGSKPQEEQNKIGN